MIYILLAALLSFICTLAVRSLARRCKIVDQPDGGRKRHGRPVALLGGLPIFVTFWGLLGLVFLFGKDVGLTRIASTLVVLFAVSLIFLLLGLWDELKPLSFATRLPLLVIGILLVAVVSPLTKLTNPSGGWFVLPFWFGGALVFGWLMLTTLSVKILDGLDGLATGVGIIGALIIAGLTFSTKFYQPNVGVVALILAGALAGFWLFNAPPASIFLGESGSLFIGLMLGGLAVLAGSKIATALLVMAVPVLDLVRVVIGRAARRESLWRGDRSHLHFVLLDRGWSERQVLALFLGVAALFGLSGLYLQSLQKIFALLLVALGFVVLAVRLTADRAKI